MPLSLAIAPGPPPAHAVAVGGADGALALSHDGGASWSMSAGRFTRKNVVTVAFSPNFDLDGTLFAATAGDGAIAVYRTTDRGASWKAG